MAIDTFETKKVKKDLSAFEICRRAADGYMNSGKPLYITAKDLCGSIVTTNFMARLEMESYNPEYRTEGPVIIDLRSPDSEMHELYYCGHIPGALHIPWRQITQLKILNILPKDRQIVVYSNIGQTGGQAAAILSIMGYDAVNLKWGMTSWTRDDKSAPEHYDMKRDIIWQNSTYRNTVTINLEPEVTYPLPDIRNNGQNPMAVIWSSVDNYLSEFKPANISANALYDPLFEYIHPLAVSPYEDDNEVPLVLPFCARTTENEESYDWPFILDIRSQDRYYAGHIPGSLHIEAKDVFKKDNLKKLPPDRRIVVCSNTGHTSAHVVALLNILGYDAINLKWGMSGWTVSQDSEGNHYDRYSDERDCMDYPIVKGWNPGKAEKCRA